MHYARLANKGLAWDFDFSDHYSYRWTILLATMVSYALFGISDFASSLPAMALSAIMLYLFYHAYKDRPWLLLIGLLLLFGARWLVFYTDKLMPDIYVTVCLFLSWWLYQRTERPSWPQALLIAGAAWLAFLSKGTIILIIPLAVYELIRAIMGRRYLALIKVGSLLAVFVVVYLLLCWVVMGSPFARFEAIAANAYFNPCSYDQMPFEETIARWTIGFFSLLVDEWLWIYLLFAIGIKVFLFINKGNISDKRALHHYANTIIILIASLNFMTISLTSYSPACLDMRHFIFAIPIVVYSTIQILSGLLLKTAYKVLVSLILILLCIPSIQHGLYGRSMHYPRLRSELYQLADQYLNTKKVKIIADPVMVHLLDYYSGFNYTDRLINVKKWQPGACISDCLLVNSWFTNYHAHMDQSIILKKLNTSEDQLTNLTPNGEWTLVTIYKIDF